VFITQWELARAVNVMMARAKRMCTLIFKVSNLFSAFSPRVFLKEKTCSPCFYRVIEVLVKVGENSEKLWKHSPTARVPTAFLVLPNFHSWFYLTIRLFALDFSEVIVDEAEDRINYRLIEIESK